MGPEIQNRFKNYFDEYFYMDYENVDPTFFFFPSGKIISCRVKIYGFSIPSGIPWNPTGSYGIPRDGKLN